MHEKGSREERKRLILENSLKVFIKNGLENTGMRELAAENSMNVSTIYDYFKSKEVIVLECVKSYLHNLNDKLEEEFQNRSDNLKEEAQRYLALLSGEKYSLRFVYQVIASPKYGEAGRGELEKIYMEIMNYSNRLALVFGIDESRFEAVFLLFVATVHDFCLWDNQTLLEKKMACIYKMIDKEFSK